jgi:hypothetical protein
MRNHSRVVGALVFTILMMSSLFAGTVVVSTTPTDGAESEPTAFSTPDAIVASSSDVVSTLRSGTSMNRLLGAERTYNVTNSGESYYNLDGYEQPEISLVRGKTYTFDVDASGHPFHISTDPNGGDFSGIYTDGVSVTNPSGANPNATETGTLMFTVSNNAPDTLYYQCGSHNGMGAAITVVDAGNGSAANRLHRR